MDFRLFALTAMMGGIAVSGKLVGMLCCSFGWRLEEKCGRPLVDVI